MLTAIIVPKIADRFQQENKLEIQDEIAGLKHIPQMEISMREKIKVNLLENTTSHCHG